MVVLRSVRGGDEGELFVPQLGVNVAFLFVLASVAVFLIYIHHIAQSIRAARIVASIGRDTRALIEHRHPLKPDDPDTGESLSCDGQVGPSHIVAAGRPGIVVAVDDAMLARLAEGSGCVVQLLRAIGEFVPAGAALLRGYGQRPPRTGNCARGSSSVTNAPWIRTSASGCANSSTSPTGCCPQA